MKNLDIKTRKEWQAAYGDVFKPDHVFTVPADHPFFMGYNESTHVMVWHDDKAPELQERQPDDAAAAKLEAEKQAIAAAFADARRIIEALPLDAYSKADILERLA